MAVNDTGTAQADWACPGLTGTLTIQRIVSVMGVQPRRLARMLSTDAVQTKGLVSRLRCSRHSMMAVIR